MTPTVELIFDSTCPHVEAAREQLRQALAQSGRQPVWIEWDRAAPDAPEYARRHASPSVLVAGRDVVSDTLLDAGPGCRIYRDAEGARLAAPSTQMILAALAAAARDS